MRSSLLEAPQAPTRQIATIATAVRSAASRWPDSAALVDGDVPSRRWTFAEIAVIAEHVAAALLQRYAPGEHVAVWSANRPEWTFLEFGAAMAGLTLVTVNPALGRAEAGDVLGRSEVVAVFCEPDYRGRDLVGIADDLRPELPRLRDVNSFAHFDHYTNGSAADLPTVAPSTPAQIQYTSGTTGLPKGALLTHRGLVDNSWFYASVIGASHRDVWINPMPLFHTAGCGLITLGALQTGGCQVLMRAFDPDRMLDLIQSENGTLTCSVPTMLVRVLDAQRARVRDVTRLRLWLLGGAPVAPGLIRRAKHELQTDVGIGYGQTEASPYITHTLPADPHPHWDETVGRPLPHISVRIAQPDDGATATLGQVGEICTRSSCVMVGYYNDLTSTDQAFDADGWLHTGDLGMMDEHGYLRIVGRLKDMIIRGGENVYPREIEDLLHNHPAVAEAAVIGVPDGEWGEQVAAVVRLRGRVTSDELTTFCRLHLASFKVPRLWRFVNEFPQTASGKVLKFELRDQLRDERD